MVKSEVASVEGAETQAVTSPTVNKTQAIHDYLKKHRGALPLAVCDALRAQGIEVTAKYVSNIKSQIRAKAHGKKPAASRAAGESTAKGASTATGAAPKAKPVAADEAANSDEIALSALLEAKKLTEKLGGIEAAKRAILALAQLSK